MDRKRVTVIFAVAWMSAALLSWFLYKQTRAPRNEKLVSVLAASHSLAAGTLVKESDLKTIGMREKEVPAAALKRKEEAVNRAVLVDVAFNEPLLDPKLAKRAGIEGVASTIEDGMRAVAVKIDPVSGAGELLEPNAHVDVLFTKPGKMSEAITTTILQNVKVLSVGRKVHPGEKLDPKIPKLPVVTLLVSPEQAQTLELAKNQGKISLVLRNPMDMKNLSKTDPVTTEVLDPLAMARGDALRARLKGRRSVAAPGGLGGSSDDPSPDLKKVKKAEPPPPKFVMDVFRGGKHTQEVFR